LDERIDQLLPTITLPKYIQKLKVSSFAASDITVLAADESPADFLKAVINTEPGPTIRDIQVMKKIEREGLQHQLRVPFWRGLVHLS
jgi:hypothetical protein